MKDYQIRIGGMAKEELLKKINEKSIRLNPLAENLIKSELFQMTETKEVINLTEITLEELGMVEGKTGLLDIFERAKEVGLAICLPEVALFLRLSYVEDPESHGFEKKYRTPHGAVTVASEILDEDPGFPKGFYLRKVDGDYWLRGYTCDYEHQFSLDETFIFMGRIKK